jgi:hypothetical protein
MVSIMEIITFINHLHPLALISLAASLLLQHRATKDYKTQLRAPWIEDLREQTKSMLDKMEAKGCSKSSKELVQSKVLPSLFYVAKLYERLCQLNHEDGQSKSDIVIQWQQICGSKKKKIDMVDDERIPLKRVVSGADPSSFVENWEGIVTRQLSQPKRKCEHRTGEVTLPQHPGAIHKSTDSPTPLHTYATYYPFQDSLSSQRPQKPGWEQIKQNALDCPYEALQNRTVTHDTHFTVATSPQSINNTIMQPKYTSAFSSDQHDYNNMASCWPILGHEYQL